MFDDVDELVRLDHASSLGFDLIEWLFPYKNQIEQIHNRLGENQQRLVLINSALGDAQSGDKGIGALPNRVDEFKKAFELSLEYATELGVGFIHVMAGLVPEGESNQRFQETFVKNLDWALAQTSADSPTLLIEPLNRVDSPNYLHATCEEAMSIINELDGAVGLQFDFYHLQIMQGNIGALLKKYFNSIKHVQFSSVPGRHEPQFGEVNCDFLFDLLDEMNYDGIVGCEYSPKNSIEEGLIWRQRYLS